MNYLNIYSLLLSLVLTVNSLKIQAQEDNRSYKVFVGVNVVQMDPARILNNQDVLIKGDRISKIIPSGDLLFGDTVRIVNAKDLFIIPGLIDAHTHMDEWVGGSVYSDSLLYTINGVTTIMNLRGDEKVLALRNSLRELNNYGLHPDLYTSGNFINEPYFLTPEEVETEVRRQHEMGYDFIKMHGNMSEEAFAKLHETARELNIKVIGHAPRNLGMKPVFEQKQTLAHAEEFMFTSFSPARTTFWYFSWIGGGVIVLMLFICRLGISLYKFIKRKTLVEPKAFKAIDNWLGLNSFLGFIILSVYLLSVPPYFPFFLNSIIARLIMITCCFILFFGVYRMHDMLKVFISRKIKVFYDGIIVLICIIGFFSTYWIVLSFRTTDYAIEQIAKRTAASGIVVCPNLVAYKTIADSHFPDRAEMFSKREEMLYLTQHNRTGFLNRNDPQKSIKAYIAPGFEKQVAMMQKLVRSLHNKGVQFLAGTDTGIYWIFPGISLHEELKLMVQSGVSSYSTLKAATINAARFLGKDLDFGDLKEGMRADVVLLKENPVKDIENISEIEGVMIRGRWLPKDLLDKMKGKIAIERQ